MAADLIIDPKTKHMFVHNLESAFYVILWLSIRLLHNNWPPNQHSFVMADLFNPSTFADVGSPSKMNWMAMASPIID
jgi:hypothetical protein